MLIIQTTLPQPPLPLKPCFSCILKATGFHPSSDKIMLRIIFLLLLTCSMVAAKSANQIQPIDRSQRNQINDSGGTGSGTTTDVISITPTSLVSGVSLYLNTNDSTLVWTTNSGTPPWGTGSGTGNADTNASLNNWNPTGTNNFGVLQSGGQPMATMYTTQTLSNKTLITPTVYGLKLASSSQSGGGVGSASTNSWSLGTIPALIKTMTNDYAYQTTSSNPTESPHVLGLIQDSTGGRAVGSWNTANYRFPNNQQPVLDSAAGATNLIFFWGAPLMGNKLYYLGQYSPGIPRYSFGDEVIRGNLTVSNNLTVGTATIGSTLLSMGGGSISNAVIVNPSILAQTLTYATATTVDWNQNAGTLATFIITNNVTFNAPSNIKPGSSSLRIVQNATGGYQPTWNAIFKWSNGTAPTISGAAGSTSWISFLTFDGTVLSGVCSTNFK